MNLIPSVIQFTNLVIILSILNDVFIVDIIVFKAIILDKMARLKNLGNGLLA